jgi:hypothetical protein
VLDHEGVIAKEYAIHRCRMNATPLRVLLNGAVVLLLGLHVALLAKEM